MLMLYYVHVKSLSREKNPGSSFEKFPSLILPGNTRRLQQLIIQFPLYLTIGLWARDFYEVIVDEAEGWINYRLIEIESE